MKAITLTQGYVAIIDDGDYASVSQFKWAAHVYRNSDGSIKNVYAIRSLGKDCHPKQELLHRRLMGVTDPKIQVDHINHWGLSCWRSNLRIATPRENTCNSRKRSDNTSGYKGVSKSSCGPGWNAFICIKGETHYLGTRRDIIAAACLYDAAASEAFGEFANLNFAKVVT